MATPSVPTCGSCSGSGCSSCGGSGASIAIARQMLAIAQQQANIANEKYDYYKTNYRPIEDELIQKAKTGQDPEYNAGRASWNVAQGFQNTGRSVNRYLQGIGIKQDDPRYAAADKDLLLAEAAAKAGAANTAREGTKEYNQNLRYAIAGFSLPAQAGAMNAVNTAGLSYGSAGTGANQGQALGIQSAANERQNSTNQFMAGLDTRQFESTRDYNNKLTDMKIAQAEAQSKNSAMSALGSALPMLGAIGGSLIAPGIGTTIGAGLGGMLAGGMSGGAQGAAMGGLVGAGSGFLASGGLSGASNWWNQTPSSGASAPYSTTAAPGTQSANYYYNNNPISNIQPYTMSLRGQPPR